MFSDCSLHSDLTTSGAIGASEVMHVVLDGVDISYVILEDRHVVVQGGTRGM
jgi:hypothetical protein